MKVNNKFTDMFKYVIKEIQDIPTFDEVTSRRQRDYVSSSTRLRLVMTLLLLMTVGVTGVLAQTDFSGTYYIANETNHANGNYGTHWYLVPGADPHAAHYADAYFHNEYCNKGGKGDYTGTNYGDPEKPFLTTYQTNQDLNSIWIISSTGDGYYNIKHAKTGYYVVYEPPYKDAIHRKSMHLESTETPGENAKFTITGSLSGPININPKSVTSGNMYFNPAVGVGNRAQYYGTGDYYHEGMIGLWNAAGDKSQWYLEKTAIPPTITYDEDTGKATITSVTGTTIRYAFDGTTPTTSSTTYTEPVSMAGHTSIKAIAVDAENTVSKVVTLTLKEYTYHILNKAGTIAIEHTLKQPVGKSFTNTYTDIPAAICSPYLEDEEVKFFNNSAHADEHEISETPSTGTGDIYVTYSTTHLEDKFMHLNGARQLNITINGDYIYDSGTAAAGVLSHTSSDTGIGTTPYLWSFSGEDPYAIEIKNAETDNYLGYTTPISSPTPLLLEDSSTKKFIIMATSGGGDYQQMELMAATGGNTYYRVELADGNLQLSTVATGTSSSQICAYPNSVTVKYELIDQAGKIIMEISSKSESVELPSDWQSPLVSTYNYWKVGAFDTYGTGDNTVYKLKADPESYRISTLSGMEGDKIYVTYEVNDKVVFDISDDDKTHPALYPTYMLRFYQGENFYQENGKDGIDVSAQKAEYPYSNGDAMLYIYSDPKRENQFASGASTRPRWLWYAVSPQAATVNNGVSDVQVTPGYKGDPYHVKIMSYSADVKTKADASVKHQNFFRTYVENYGGSDHVVTGLTTNHDDVSDAAPTEYMVLNVPNAPNGGYKLVTVNPIDGAPTNGSYGTRQTVNTFEQYWKNNPTVQNRLGDAKVNQSESKDDDGIELTSSQASLLTGWHTYKKWAQAAPWVSWSEDGKTGKDYHNKHHWFQTIDMGSTGEFTFEAQSIDPEVILLDQHGWEIMRAPLSDAATLRKYDSPMVEEYQWYPAAAKVTGYHKYKVSDPNIPVYYSYTDANGKTKWAATGDSITFTSTTLGANPYDYIVERGYQAQDKSVKTDFYVTYTVRPEYARLYSGAATEGGVTPSAFMVKQGDEYAKINNSNQLDPTTDNPYNLESIGDEWHWYVKPNFNIDSEMGYLYDVEEEDVSGVTKVLNQSEKEALNYAEGRNGFDPYNVQIQSVKSSTYYFKTSTTGSHLVNGVWEGSSTDLSLKNMSVDRQLNIEGNNQTTLTVTNATFMVVKDASGHMLLMPRFDHTKVVNSFTAPRLSAVNAASKSLELLMAPKLIHSSDEFLSMNGQYTLADDFTFDSNFESLGSEANPFTGSIDGALHTLTGISTPLVAYADGAIIKNVIFNNVTIGNKEDVPNVGAVVANATGETRIYNCGILSGSVSGTGNAGSIVGNLDGSSRVINCYSYANVTGTTNTGGIVGYNAVANVSSTNIKTMVMNCMFYGDVTGGKVSPIYGGEIIDNLGINNSSKQGLNNFTYYAYEKSTSFNSLKDNNANKVYNNALAIEERFLTRFEIYRQLLNSNRRLAAYYATSSEATVNANAMMKWVLETADKSIDSPKEYPVLKAQAKYPSIINYDIEHASDSATVGRNHGGRLGRTLRVYLSGTGITTSQLDLERTDKDFDRFNFNYDKVQLPYFNDVGTGNYTNNQVVTGWKITGITTIDGDPYTSANYPSTGITDYPNHNYADRKSSNKDLYSVSGRVFSQGAYFDVPYGVSEITIEPYWATAAYVADEYLDVAYETGWTGHNVTQLGKQFPTGKITINGSEQVGYKSISDALSGKSSSSVYDLAIVLVGNLHSKDVPSNGNVPFTVMSVDLDHDNEPDYSYIYSHGTRAAVSPIRFDFINVPGTAQAQKPKGATQLRNAAIFNTKGWFELTNTALMYFSQIEYENNSQTLKAPMILQGGVVDQFVSTVSHKVDGDNIYIHVGGNVWFKSFTMGTHGDGSESTPHVPVSVTGGDYDSFYLTGMYNSNATVRDDNAECYISGGRFGEVAGAGQEQIGIEGGGKGNIHWQIYNADISEFYGGGINEAKPAKGNIQTDIFNSYVDKFCGGPKFGNMATGKTVVTNATGCTFGKYFGAGNGGNSYSRKKYYDKDGIPTESTWNTLNGYYTTDRGKFFDGTTTGSSQTSGKDYGKKGYGVATDFDYEFFVWTSGTAGVRIYVNFASFSLAQCNDVTSTLTNCTINQDFYGGGNLGSVIGTATSTLNGCTVHGNVFGGGYSAELPKIPVRDAGFTKYPNFNTNSGMFESGEFSDTTHYEWKHVDSDPANGTVGIEVSEEGKFVKTKANLTALGQVANTNLTVTNNCLIEGSVFGGGDMSAVNENTLVKIDNAKDSESEEAQKTILNVYGGGNTADVLGDTEVRMTSGEVAQSVYGGGKGQTTVVKGDVTVNIGTKTGEAPDITYTGNGTVDANVYGGSALGAVNATKDPSTGALSYTAGKKTNVNIYAGTVNGSVFGGGLGHDDGDDTKDVAAQNFGNTTVIVENSNNANALVKAGVYGGSNANGVLRKDAVVTITGGTVGDSEHPDEDVVFGGGFGAPTLVNGNVTVNIGTKGQTSGGATIYGHAYGGGALGNTNEEWVTDNSTTPATTTLKPVANTKTLVNLYKGTINGYAYGGGLGNASVPAYVGGDSVIVTLDGAKVRQVFGANNINGTPLGHVLVHVKRTTGGSTKDSDKSREERTATDPAYVYDVEAVYGGGNEADYVPTNATLVLNPEAEGYKADSTKFANARTEVIIEGCDTTSIEFVYGGGNAAAVPATDVTVKGTYIVNTLYGGGNGADPLKSGADVGIYKDGETPTNYGTGKAETKLLGGYINTVYGGSNTKGDVRGGTDVHTKNRGEAVDGDCCPELKVGDIYGAGSHADVTGDVKITLGCMPEDFVDAVYGGAEEAIIDGNVELTVTSGKFGRVFGGNNKGGDIRGSITVNVNEYGCKPLIIGELYGGGNAAPYSVFGCTNTAGKWTPNESGDSLFNESVANRAAVQVNVLACTSIGKVFGGGMGSTAKVRGNTHVYINMMKGFVDTNGDGVEEERPNIGKIGQIFGGGGQADVIGNTLLDIGTASASEGVGVNIVSGTDYLKTTTDADTTITAGIYGGGYSADVVGNTTLNIGTYNQKIDDEPSITIAGNVFGGGFGKNTTVTGDVVVNIGADNKQTVNDKTTYSYEGYAKITGDVYGGSAMGKVNATKGESYASDPTDISATSGKETKVNFYGGTITGNIYGGGQGQRAAAGPPAVSAIAANVYGPVTVTMEQGDSITTVNNVFGCNNYYGAPQDTVVIKINGGTVKNSVYGGGNQAEYTAPTGHKDYPAVRVFNGTINENVFGGGLGQTATVAGNPHVTIGDKVEGHTVTILKSVYGGGSEATVNDSTNVVVNNGTIGTEGEGAAVYGNIYGGGLGSEENVRIGLVKGNTRVTINGGTILHNIYGGGAYGSVGTYTYGSNPENPGNVAITGHTENTGKATITVLGGTIGTNGHNNGMIFGSSRGDIDAPGRIHDNLAWVYETDVVIGKKNDTSSGPQINGSLYGSGENGHTYKNASVTIHSGTIGITDTSIDGGAAYQFRGNVYGGGCGTDKYYSGAVPSGHTADDGEGDKYNITAGIVGTSDVVGNATVTIDGGHVVRNVYGAGAMGSVTGKTTVNISGNSKIGAEDSDGGYVYAAARGNSDMEDGYATVGSTELNISGGTIWGSAFGGGQLGTVKGSVDVTVSGGEVKNDVYGGGALANTNTDNWSVSGSAFDYVTVTGLTPSTYEVESVEVGESVEELYILSDGKHVEATGTAVGGTTYYRRTSTGTSVAGYYTRSGSEGSYVYTLVTNGNAESGITYYRKKVAGKWADGKNGDGGTTYKTNVTLIGGLIGNAYGGGLGQIANGDDPSAEGYKPAIAAMVYGDVKITVNHPDSIGTAPGVAFTQNTTEVEYGEDEKRKKYIIPLTGRVFGCNNQNGTPTGNVRVEVHSTRQIDDNNNIIDGHGSSNRKYPNEMRAVYGGGNLSDYLPADGKSTSVYIDGCSETSIEKVYGGGNSASVPATNVTINACYDIGYAFGGGNGGDLIYKNDEWIENEGAIVIGLAKIAPKGGKIGQVFGGSDAKGVCGSTTVDLSNPNESCSLVLTRIYGAGNEADVADNVNMIISGCTDGTQIIGGEPVSTQIEYVYGGSYNAHITGNVTLTITSGIYKYVYGGNDRTGSIGGNITVNIEEKDDCKPIIIESLLGGGNEAAYPGTKRNGDEIITPGKITVNVKSATYIGEIFGGSYKSDVNGDTKVNINMTKGLWAGARAPIGYTHLPNVNKANYAKVVSPVTEDIANYYEKNGNNYTKTSDTEVNSDHTYYTYSADKIDVIADSVGVIGTIYGGGNQGVVRGNSVVNIATSTTVDVIDVVTKDGTGKITEITYKDAPVLGAHITGDVFGGGNEANVNGNDTVNICTADYSDVSGFEGVSIGESVYGGGNASDVLGNTFVTMSGGYVFDGVYGGGLHGSVGTVATRAALPTGHPSHTGCVLGKPETFKSGTGKCTVVFSGGQVGPVETALTDGGMKNTARYYKDPNDEDDKGPVDVGFIFGAGRGNVENPNVVYDADFHTYVNETDVTISGGIVMASVYGGGENGRVRGNTLVKITGGQIGCGEGKTRVVNGKTVPIIHTEDEWTEADSTKFNICASLDYGKVVNGKKQFYPFDPFANLPYGDGSPCTGADLTGFDGHTYYGCVFGGGSGYYPYEIELPGGNRHDWLRSAGMVEGSTRVEITGGHILTNVYGGNEYTDVTGDSCVVIMTGGTLGVPRSDAKAAAHPITCYLFGAGKGDPRTHFNTWTNVNNTRVHIGGSARIFGSVLGGGEDGHVLKNTKVHVVNGTIGTTGTSSFDGNVFGGGRGLNGEALTAGSTGSNVEMTIAGGTIKGNVYGGGRLASVGIDFTPPTDPNYGQLLNDTIEGNKQHGHITMTISGGTIGTSTASDDVHPVNGNVYGGSKGDILLLNGELNPLWPKLAVVKLTNVTISGDADIKNSVYGGSEYGIVRNYATVNITGGNVHGNVFGGGYGSDRRDTTTITPGGYSGVYYSFTPMLWTGCVSGSTFVNVSGGKVEKNVYGGGDMASVGLIDFVSDEHGNFTNMPKHDNPNDGFALSWPYKFTYHPAAPADPAVVGGGKINGKSTVNISGSADIVGYVFGAGKGKVSFGADGDGKDDIDKQRYTEAFMSNVRESEVTISGGSVRTVYGGGEDGHVYENAKVTINSGATILRTVFGGGKGTSKFKTTLLGTNPPDSTYSWTAGKVYGNTEVIMNGGSVGWFIYGGGNNASVGKGNYSGGIDDYSTAGYGETLTDSLWKSSFDSEKAESETNKKDFAWHFLNSGNTTVKVLGGRVGPESGDYASEYGIPLGSVFGGSRGKAAKTITQSPRYKYGPDFYLGYVNKATINIGGYIVGNDTTISDNTPTIKGSIYGGGQDGHVRNSTEVRIFKGNVAGQGDYRSGNVFGAGSGIGTYEDNDNNYCNNASGSVTCTTLVEVNGGSISGSVYGGGALASVGPPKIGQAKNEQKTPTTGHNSHSSNVVNIKGGSVGGSVFGASRGPAASFLASTFEDGVSTTQTGPTYYNPTTYATSLWTEVNITGGTIGNNVYGGGEMGQVKESTEVTLKGGMIAHDAYGGGMGTRGTDASGTNAIPADIGGNTTVELNKGVASTAKGCIVEKIFGCNDLNGTPQGHALVHVYGTQHKNTAKMGSSDGGKYTKFRSMVDGYTTGIINNYKSTANSDDLYNLATAVGFNSTQIAAFEKAVDDAANDSLKQIALNNYIDSIADRKYDVLAVYGGGDLASYEPTKDEEKTEVIIDGCDLTSIKQVYGGGNAASTPANLVRINAAYEIHEAFGGGNGKDIFEIDGKWYENIGANVGYKATYHSVTSDPDKGTKADPYPAVVYEDADTPDERRANTSYHYGEGTADLEITGGRIHTTYGGSNTRGNIRKAVVTKSEDAGVCTMAIDVSYPAGKNAETDGQAKLDGRCIPYQQAIYGGAYGANVYNDVVIDVTNGYIEKIFGGNDRSGRIYGSITINIHEEGCKPIVIDKIYGGGNKADYSIYGYNDNGSARTKAQYDGLSVAEKAGITVQRDPRINIISATRIDTIYGGGYNAKLIGSPYINVNMQEGFIPKKYVDATPSDFTEAVHKDTVSGRAYTYEVTKLDDDGKAILAIGTIGTVYGGGDLGDVQGNTSVEIGTRRWITSWDASGNPVREDLDRNAANITENVFGGGRGQALASGDRAFYCEDAMVGVDGDGVANPEGGTSVIIANGTVGTLDNEDKLVAGTGNVYGGGELGRVEKNTVVTIGVQGAMGNETEFRPVVRGNVFGAGKGVETHGYSALVRGNSTVTIQGVAKVGQSVYGGGEKASIGRYHVAETDEEAAAHGVEKGMPYSLLSDNSGSCTVIVRDSAEVGPNDMIMTRAGGPDNSGHVFGAGQGVNPYEGYSSEISHGV